MRRGEMEIAMKKTVKKSKKVVIKIKSGLKAGRTIE